jgi:hypothetical protein
MVCCKKTFWYRGALFFIFFYFGVGYRVAVVVVFASPSLELGFGWMDYKDKAPANLVPRLAVSVSAS